MWRRLNLEIGSLKTPPVVNIVNGVPGVQLGAPHDAQGPVELRGWVLRTGWLTVAGALGLDA